MPSYRIQINRSGEGEGRLVYRGTFYGSFPCWWDPDDQIQAGLYTGCSKTFMATAKNSRGKSREGIFFPNVPGRVGIFIHYWPGPGADRSLWSDGCTLLLERDILRIWNDITPQDGHNVTVEVRDVASGPSHYVPWPSI